MQIIRKTIICHSDSDSPLAKCMYSSAEMLHYSEPWHAVDRHCPGRHLIPVLSHNTVSRALGFLGPVYNSHILWEIPPSYKTFSLNIAQIFFKKFFNFIYFYQMKWTSKIFSLLSPPRRWLTSWMRWQLTLTTNTCQQVSGRYIIDLTEMI